MLDITEFNTKEAAGLVSLVRITDNALAISAKNFSPSTGEELAETVTGGSLKEYKDRIVELQTEIAKLEGFVAKIEAIVPQNKEVVAK